MFLGHLVLAFRVYTFVLTQEESMAALDTADRVSPKTAPRPRHPHPGESMPTFAWPTFVLAVGALIVYALTVIAAVGHYAPVWVIIPLSSAVTYVMFAVAHETLHRSFSSIRWANAVVGRLAWMLVVPMFSLPAFNYIHIQHHRHANDPQRDPDRFATHGPAWKLPLRWALMDVFYAIWYTRRLPERLRRSWRRPMAELAETVIVFSVTSAGICAAVATGNFWVVAIVVLIPQRIGFVILGWSFDWLPHHGLEVTQRESRYRASRNRVGMEWLLTPLMLSQNYHLVHHIHPWLPFYRYVQAWRRNESAYLEHGAVITVI
jgi:ring-1,2-phenylacetyl-CoA epoxidase subunit PaaE